MDICLAQMTNAFSAHLTVFFRGGDCEIVSWVPSQFTFSQASIMDNDKHNNSRPPRRNGGNGRFGAPRSGGRRFDGPRKHSDDNVGGGDGDFKPRRFSGERKSFDRHADGGDGDFKPRRFSDERKRFGDGPRFGGKPRFDRDERENSGTDEPFAEGEEKRRFKRNDEPRYSRGNAGFRKERFLNRDDGARWGGDSGRDSLASADDKANQDVAESFSSSPANEGEEKPVREERPAPKPLPLPRHRKIAVFGGSFDPIHNGHLMMAEYILARGLADEILFIPSAIPPHKAGMTVATPEQRLEMVRLATAYNERFSYSDMELRREGKSYSFDTMSMLQKLYPDHLFSFIIGMDSLVQLHSWYRASELVQRVDFIIYPRPNVEPPAYLDLCAAFGNRNAVKLLNSVLPLHDSVVTYEPSEVVGEPDKRVVTEFDLPRSVLSSTEIRKALAEKRLQELQGALPEPVLNYITENNLYRE